MGILNKMCSYCIEYSVFITEVGWVIKEVATLNSTAPIYCLRNFRSSVSHMASSTASATSTAGRLQTFEFRLVSFLYVRCLQPKTFGTISRSCVCVTLREGHANRLYIVPILVDVAEATIAATYFGYIYSCSP